MTRIKQFGYLPLCTPDKGKPWFAGSVSVGYSAQDTRVEFTKLCSGQSEYITSEWEALKKEGWRIVRVAVSTVQ